MGNVKHTTVRMRTAKERERENAAIRRFNEKHNKRAKWTKDDDSSIAAMLLYFGFLKLNERMRVKWVSWVCVCVCMFMLLQCATYSTQHQHQHIVHAFFHISHMPFVRFVWLSSTNWKAGTRQTRDVSRRELVNISTVFTVQSVTFFYVALFFSFDLKLVQMIEYWLLATRLTFVCVILDVCFKFSLDIYFQKSFWFTEIKLSEF